VGQPVPMQSSQCCFWFDSYLVVDEEKVSWMVGVSALKLLVLVTRRASGHKKPVSISASVSSRFI